jgi:predicted nucleic acid-binding protein
MVAREIQAGLIDSGQAAGIHPIDLLIAATALGHGFTVLTDDGDYAHQIAAARSDLRARRVGDGPD